MSPREAAVLFGMCLIWGFHFVVIKLAIAEIPPIFYAALRMTLAAVLVAPFLRWRSGRMRPVLAASLCFGAFNYAFMFTGISYATASAAALAMELHIPFATILSVIFLNDRIAMRRILAIAFVFVGVAIIALGKDSSGGSNIALGVMLVASGAFVEAVGAVLVKKAEGFKPIELLAWFSFIGSLALWSLTAVIESDHAAAFAASDKRIVIPAIMYSAIGGSLIAHTSYYWLLQRLPISTVAPSVLLATLIAVISGVIVLGDPFGPRQIIGGLMVLAGVGVIILRNTKKQDIKAPMIEPGAGP